MILALNYLVHKHHSNVRITLSINKVGIIIHVELTTIKIIHYFSTIYVISHGLLNMNNTNNKQQMNIFD